MKLAMIRTSNGSIPAAQLSDGRYLDLAAAGAVGLIEGPLPATVVDVIDATHNSLPTLQRLVEAVEEARPHAVDRLREANGLLAADAVSLASPLRPALILCTGGAYRDHLQEMNVALSKTPAGFIKAPHTVIGPQDPIVLPLQAPDMVDFECEFACVFSRPCYNVDPSDALDHVGGYTMINDVSARDAVSAWLASLQNGSPRQACELWDRNVLHKQHPTFCPLGPVVTTRDEIPDPHDVRIRTRLNGTLMQSAHTADLYFALPEVISYFSRYVRFAPGDVLTTGSPSGVGFARSPQVFLRPGDVVTVEGDGIGSLINPVVADR